MSTAPYSLVFDGDIELVDGDEGTYSFELVTGATFGSGEPIEVLLASLISDGSLVENEGTSNAEVTLPIRIVGTDPVGLADGRARLDRATGKRTTLVWRDDDYPATVFDVETSSLASGAFDDVSYRHNEMTVGLRLVCLPFTRSESPLVDVAESPPGPSAGTVFYSAESTTGWATYGGDEAAAFTVDSTLFVEGTGSVKSKVTQWEPGFVFNLGNGTGGAYSPPGGTGRDQVTGLSLDTATGGYVSVSIRFEPANDLTRLTRVWQQIGGAWVEVTNFASVAFRADGFVQYRWPVAAGLTITGFRFESLHGRSGSATELPNPFVWFDDFRLTTTASTDQQVTKTLNVLGSARTVGSLRIASGTESVALGQVLVATLPSDAVAPGFTPEGRPFVTQGTLIADATALQGAYYAPNATTFSTAAGTPIFDIPAASLTPGAYRVVTLVKPGTVTDKVRSGVQAQLNVDGTLTGPTSECETLVTRTSDEWQFLPVGTLFLPPVAVQGADTTTTVRLIFKGDILGNVYLIPAWQVRGRAIGDFSIIDCGTGIPSNSGSSSYLWIDSPSSSQPQGGYWRGPTDDRLNSRSAWSDAIAPGTHFFRPGQMTGFLAVTGAIAPSLALEYFPTWAGWAAL
jgi:hypothetical protein